jgi:fucose permease
VGGVITFLFLGALIAQLIAGTIIDTLGIKGVLVVSVVLFPRGRGFTVARSLFGFFLLFIAGLGQGSQNLAVNPDGIQRLPREKYHLLNLLHFFFGLGASADRHSSAWPSPLSLPFHRALDQRGVVCLAGYFLSGALPKQKPEKSIRANPLPGRKPALYRSPLLWVLGLFLLVYVASEYAWGAGHLIHGGGGRMSVKDGALITSAYWGFSPLAGFGYFSQPEDDHFETAGLMRFHGFGVRTAFALW